MEGSIIVVHDHKTPDNGPAYIWLSSVDRVLLKCYEAIILQHCERTGQIFNLEGPFFVTSTMTRWIGAEGKRPLDYSEFCQACGITYYRSHMNRNMFQTYLQSSTSLILRECAGI